MYYSLVGRDVEHEVVPLCHHEKLAFLPWSPLAGGFLTGKYRRDDAKKPEGSRFATSKFGEFPPVDKAKGFDVVDKLVALAEKNGTTPATLALKWLLCKPIVTSVIIGVKRIDQLVENLRATSLSACADDINTLDEMTAPSDLYPNWMIQRQAQSRRL